MQFIKLLVNLTFSRNFNLINSPLQYLCFIEFLKKKHSSNKVIYVGYCSNKSKEQIKYLNKNFYKINLEIFFLDEILDIKIFHLLLFFFKKLKRKFLMTVCGTCKYYLFNEFIKKSKNVVFLDEGFDLLVPENQDEIIKYDPTVFSYFDISNVFLKFEKNNFSYINSIKKKKKTVDQNLLFFLGTTFFESKNRLDFKNKYIHLLNKHYKNMKIKYFPHRNENIRQNLFGENFEIINIDVPIEIYILELEILPSIICGYYSTALYTLNKILSNSAIKIININFDLDLYNWNDQLDYKRHILFSDELNKNGIINFFNKNFLDTN